jgi:hypothetical protein
MSRLSLFLMNVGHLTHCGPIPGPLVGALSLPYFERILA